MRHADGRNVVVPVHAGRDMPKGTLRNILAIVGLTADEFRQLLSSADALRMLKRRRLGGVSGSGSCSWVADRARPAGQADGARQLDGPGGGAGSASAAVCCQLYSRRCGHM